MRNGFTRACAICSLAAVWALGGCATTTTYAPARYATTTTTDAAAYFWDDLSPHGEWLHTRGYGWVWSPYDTYAGWRPYTYGRWAYSDYGWTWVSYWDWGAAPFHYGRWTYERPYGWVWVPGRTWGPAWVAWRQGPGVVGWAPLPPSAVYVPGYGVRFGRGGVDVAIGSSWWVFTEPRYLTSSRVYAHTFSGRRVPAVLRSTRPVVRYDQGRHGVIHRGLDVASVERQAGRSMPRLRDDDGTRTRAMRAEPPARPLERQRVRRGQRDPLGVIQRQRPEERTPSRDRLRRPAPMPRPDERIRPRPQRPVPPVSVPRSLGAERRRPSVDRDDGGRRPGRERPEPARPRTRPPRR